MTRAFSFRTDLAPLRRVLFARPFWLSALIILASLPAPLLADTPEVRMDDLLSSYPYYADPNERAKDIPRLVALWRQIDDCVASTNVLVSDLSNCVSSVHQQCYESRAAGDGTDDPGYGSIDRACWNDEYFAWELTRSDARQELIDGLLKAAKKYPEYFPAGGADGGYSIEKVIADIGAFDAEIDRLSSLSCAVEIGVQGVDPARSTVPLTAIDSSFSCGIPWHAEAVWRFKLWQRH